MSEGKKEDVTLDIKLPTPEAAELTSKAAAEGVSTPEYLGIHVLRSAYGSLHPRVLAFFEQNSGDNRDSEG